MVTAAVAKFSIRRMHVCLLQERVAVLEASLVATSQERRRKTDSVSENYSWTDYSISTQLIVFSLCAVEHIADAEEGNLLEFNYLLQHPRPACLG